MVGPDEFPEDVIMSRLLRSRLHDETTAFDARGRRFRLLEVLFPRLSLRMGVVHYDRFACAKQSIEQWVIGDSIRSTLTLFESVEHHFDRLVPTSAVPVVRGDHVALFLELVFGQVALARPLNAHEHDELKMGESSVSRFGGFSSLFGVSSIVYFYAFFISNISRGKITYFPYANHRERKIPVNWS